MRRASFIAGIAAVALLLASVPAVASRIPAEDFGARIEAARMIAVDGQLRPSPARLADLVRTLGLPVEVEFSWGLATVDEDPVLNALQGKSSADFRRAVEHLDALSEQLREAASVQAFDRTRVRDAMRNAFDGIQTRKSWVQVARERFREIVMAVLERLARATASGFGLIAALVILAAIIALAAWLIAMRLRVVPERSTRRLRKNADRPEWRAIAVEAERRGDLDAAVRAHYQILLDELAGRGIVDDEPSLTAGECRTAVAGARPNLYSVVADATDAFEHVAYGHAEPRIEHVNRIRRATEAARAA